LFPLAPAFRGGHLVSSLTTEMRRPKLGHSMEIRSIFLVTFFMGLPAICLIYPWMTWHRVRREAPQGAWRQTLLTFALPSATLSLILVSSFLVHGYRWDEQSFVGPPPLHWAVLNWISFLAWIFVCVASAIGRGKLRVPLSLRCVAMPLLTIAYMTMGFYY
jgi:hypothetical protein